MRRIDLQQCRVRAARGRDRSSWSRSPTPPSLQSGPGGMEFSSEADVDGRAVTVAASATRDIDDTPRDGAGRQHRDGGCRRGSGSGRCGKLGAVALKLTGSEGVRREAFAADGLVVARPAPCSISARAGCCRPTSMSMPRLSPARNKIQVDRLLLKTGRSTFDFAGSIGPKPATGAAGEEPSYRYDLTSDGSTLAPSESPEPALNFIARIAGVYQTSEPQARRRADRRSGPDPASEVLGTAAVAFVDGKAPGIIRGVQRPRHAGLACQAVVAVVFGAQRPAVGAEEPVRRPRRRRQSAVPGRAGASRQRRAAFRRRGVRPFPDRRIALRHGRPHSADTRCRRRRRLPRQRCRHRAVLGQRLYAERPHRGGQQWHADGQGGQPPAGDRRARHRRRRRGAGDRRTRLLRADQRHAPCRPAAGRPVRHGDRPRQGRHSAAVRRRHLEARLAGVARLQGPVAGQAVRRPDGDGRRRFDHRRARQGGDLRQGAAERHSGRTRPGRAAQG